MKKMSKISQIAANISLAVADKNSNIILKDLFGSLTSCEEFGSFIDRLSESSSKSFYASMTSKNREVSSVLSNLSDHVLVPMTFPLFDCDDVNRSIVFACQILKDFCLVITRFNAEKPEKFIMSAVSVNFNNTTFPGLRKWSLKNMDIVLPLLNTVQVKLTMCSMNRQNNKFKLASKTLDFDLGERSLTDVTINDSQKMVDDFLDSSRIAEIFMKSAAKMNISLFTESEGETSGKITPCISCESEIDDMASTTGSC